MAGVLVVDSDGVPIYAADGTPIFRRGVQLAIDICEIAASSGDIRNSKNVCDAAIVHLIDVATDSLDEQDQDYLLNTALISIGSMILPGAFRMIRGEISPGLPEVIIEVMRENLANAKLEEQETQIITIPDE